MSRSRAKILVIRGGAIGDFILTLPVLSALKVNFPETRLELLGYPHVAQLALAGGLVEDVRSIDARPLAGFFARHGQLDQDLADYFSEFALILSYLYDPDLIFQENIARCSPAQFIACPHRPDELQPIHATETFLRPLQHLAVFDADPTPRLQLAEAGKFLSPDEPAWLALHPGSGSERKNWPEAQWAELISLLLRMTPFNLLLVGGEAEGVRLRRLAASVPGDRVKLLQSAPLVEVGRQLQPCAAFIGHDSGITHLAAAVGLPGLVLWGDTVEAVWRPQSPRMKVLRDSSGLAGIQPESVLDQLTLLMGSN